MDTEKLDSCREQQRFLPQNNHDILKLNNSDATIQNLDSVILADKNVLLEGSLVLCSLLLRDMDSHGRKRNSRTER